MKRAPSPRRAFCLLVIIAAAAPLPLPAQEMTRERLPLIEPPAELKNRQLPTARVRRARPVEDPKAAPAVPANGNGEWWTVFRDPALNDLETRVLAANPDLRRAVERITEQREQARIAAAAFFPQVQSQPSFSRTRSTDTPPFLKSRPIGVPDPRTGRIQPLSTTQNNFSLPLVASYELDVFGRIRSAYAGARALARALEADARAVRLSLTAEVATDLFALRALDAQVAVLRRTVGLRRENVYLYDQRVRADIANPLDVARARVELDNTEADLAEAERQRAGLENVLAALCGVPASDFRLPVRPLDQTPPPFVPAGLPAALLARRPDLAEAEERVRAAEAQIGVARAELLPRFTIQGSVGLAGADYDRLFEARSRDLSVMPMVTIPVFEGGRNVANLRAARAVRREAEDAYRATALNAFQEVETALANLRQRAVQGEAQARAVGDAQRVLDLSGNRFSAGTINYFDVVDAQRTLLNAQLNTVSTLNARFAATVALIRALGGGWDDAAPPPGPVAVPAARDDRANGQRSRTP